MKHLLIAILLISTVAAIDLQSGENYNLQCYNKTGILSYDQVNYSFHCEDADDCDFDYTNLVLDLSPGETVKNKQNQWNYSISCGSQNTTAAVCEYSRRIDPGKELNYETDTCDIEIECRECPEADCQDEVVERNTDIDVDIKVNNNKARIRVGEWYRTINLSDYENFSTSWQVEATCAGFLTNGTTDCGFEECQHFNVNGAFIADSFYKFADKVVEQSNKTNDCTLEKAALQVDNNKLTARVNELESAKISMQRDLNNRTATIKEKDMDIADLRLGNKFRTGWIIVIVVLLMLSFAGNVFQVIITWRRA